MTNTPVEKIVQYAKLFVVSGLVLGALSSCQASNTPAKPSKVDENDVNIVSKYGVSDALYCIPTETAFVAAHRGTVEDSEYPENSLMSLKALHEKGVLFAEIDVARLKDDTYILFHDGVWDKKTTGKGVVAATSWPQSQKLLLQDTKGQISAARPSKFTDILAWAKGKMYLEIDFKSSANPEKVISLIRDAGMIDQVVLIAYTAEQAQALYTLAPDALLSVGVKKAGDVKALKVRGIPYEHMAAWTGRGQVSQRTRNVLKEKNIPVLAASFMDLDGVIQKTGRTDLYKPFAEFPDLVVTDFAFDAQQVLELKGKSFESFNACLRNLHLENENIK